MDRNDKIAKNILLDKTCETCTKQNDKYCLQFFDAFGWQWWPVAKEHTCDNWKE